MINKANNEKAFFTYFIFRINTIKLSFKELSIKYEEIASYFGGKQEGEQFLLLITDTKLDYKALTDLAQLFFSKVIDIVSQDNSYLVTLKKLITSNSFHKENSNDIEKKYGKDSQFSQINKPSQPAFLHY